MCAAAVTSQSAIATEVAIAPLVTFTKEDVGSALEEFDAWLRSVSDGYITLERVKDLANAVPVVSNILSAIDVVMDIKRLIEAEVRDLFDYLNLGIDLIGVIPIPPVMGEFRMGARPLLKLAREELIRSGKAVAEAGGQMIADTIISVLVAHISAKFAGEIDSFVKEIKARVAQLLDDCANHAQKLLEGLAQIFEGAASGRLFDTSGNYRAADKHLHEAGEAFAAHDAGKIADSVWSYLKDGTKVFVKDAANLATRAVNEISPSTNQQLMHMATQARHAIPLVTQKIKGLNSSDVGGMLWLIDALLQAVAKWREKHGGKGAQTVGIKEAGKVEAELKKTEGELETIGKQAKAKHPGPNCKSCSAGRSAGSIGYALGDERFEHEDFMLPGAMPIIWQRTYRSFLDAYDHGELGARWITPYTTRFDIHAAKLVYHDPSGRSIDYPLLKAGDTHDDLGEGVTLAQLDEQWLTVTRGHELMEAYEKHGDAFRLGFIKDRSGNQITFDYTKDHHLSRLIAAQGVIAFSHDSAGRIVEAAHYDNEGERVGTLATYTYDREGDLVAAADRYGNRREYAYAHHLVTRYTDRTGRGMNLEWDGTGPKARCVHEYADDGTNETRLAWHPEIRLVYVTDGLGSMTRHYYDIDGYTYRIVHPDAREEWFYRDANHHVTQRIYPDGTVARFAYDARGNLVEQVRPDGSVVRMEYDAKDQMTTIVDPQGFRWEREYDDKGNVVAQIDPLGRETKYTYNGAGLPTQITDAKGGAKTLAYDANGQLTSYTDCSGKTTQWTYDAHGRLLEATDAAGHSTVYRYGANGQLSAVVKPSGIELMEHDGEGRLTEHADPSRATTRYGYDAAGRIAYRTDALGQTLAYRYDRLGRLSTLEDANHATYRLFYDPVSRLTAEIGFDGKETRYEYDAASSKLIAIDEAGAVTHLEYDRAGRLARRVAGGDEESFAYDAGGRLAEARNAHCRVQHFYDAVGNLIREHHAYELFGAKRSYVWRHEYDEIDARVRTQRPDGHTVDWLTYGAGHVHGMMLDGRELVQFERDDLHREIQRNFASQLEQRTKYDAAGRIVEQRLARASAPGHVAERRYGYDPAGQLTHIDDSRQGPTTYRYDPVGRLLEALSPMAKEQFAFDPASNIGYPAAGTTTSSASSTLPTQIPKTLGNLLQDYAGTHFDYDARGNLIGRRSPGSAQRYEWDGFNRLVSARVDEPAASREARYFYDPFGRRIARQVDRVQTIFGWDGDTLAFESSGAHSIHFVYEAGSFTPLAQYAETAVEGIETPQWKSTDRYAPEDDPLMQPPAANAPASALFYHCDQIGTPLMMTDERGDIVWEARYKAWGETIAVDARASHITHVPAQNPIRFQGQQFDDETGLAYNRYRYYDPRTGRYISQEPIGLLGNTNPYQYAPNPTDWIDPRGLKGKKAQASGQACCSPNPCEGKDPAKEARGWQGTAPYKGVDSYQNTVLKRGTVLYSLYPGGAPGYAVTIGSLRQAAGSSEKFHDLVQVTPGVDGDGNPRARRTQVRAYFVTKDICVAKGRAMANPTFDGVKDDHVYPGGGLQYFIPPSEKVHLTPGIIRNI
jgi:RHS repeat-associated protein